MTKSDIKMICKDEKTVKEVNIIPEYLTSEQFIKMTQISTSTFYRLVESKKIKAIKLGRKWKIHKSVLESGVEV